MFIAIVISKSHTKHYGPFPTKRSAENFVSALTMPCSISIVELYPTDWKKYV